MHIWKSWNFPNETRAVSKFWKVTRVIYLKILPESNMGLLFNHTKPINALNWNKYLLTEGNYKSSGNHKVAPLTVQCWLQSTMRLLQDIILQISFNVMQSIKYVLLPVLNRCILIIFFQSLSSSALLMS